MSISCMETAATDASNGPGSQGAPSGDNGSVRGRSPAELEGIWGRVEGAIKPSRARATDALVLLQVFLQPKCIFGREATTVNPINPKPQTPNPKP